jgi:hypothetical protein
VRTASQFLLNQLNYFQAGLGNITVCVVAAIEGATMLTSPACH